MKMRLDRTAAALAVVGSLSLGACSSGPGQEPAAEPEMNLEGRSEALGSGPTLIATASLDQTTDLAPASYALENGLPQNIAGGFGSGLAAAGGTTFLAVPDRGPNASAYPNGTPVDNTTSFIERFETLDLKLTPVPSGGLPFTLTPKLLATTLLYSDTPLTYGATSGLPSAVPPLNGPGKYYFTGRSDNFGAGTSTNPDFARLDTEAIVVSNDGNSIFVADEYGPYVYQFERATGRRLRSYTLPAHFAIANLSSLGANEIANNSSGRVTNKGMEGLTMTPDGSTLVALVQSPLIQDGGDGGGPNRIVTIDVASGATHEYVYDNQIGTKAYNSSEILALNDHQFLIDTRDGKGLGDGSVAVIKQLWAVDIAGAADVSNLSSSSTLLSKAVPKKRLLDMVAVLNANGIPSTQIPAKIEGLAFGPDVVVGGVGTHTLFVANDNDFVPDVAGPNRWFVFGFTDDDLTALGLSYTPRQISERGPDLTVSQSGSSASVVTGSSVDIVVGVRNGGLVPATGVVLSETLDPQLQLSACSASVPCSIVSNGVSLAFASLAGAASESVTLSAALSCMVADGTPIQARAASSFDAADPTPGDDSNTLAITAVNPAPSISALVPDQSTLWPPNKKMVTVQVGYSAADNCAGTSCALSVTSNEASNPANPDWKVVDQHSVELRADRNGNGSGRLYTLAVTCRDSGGAVSVGTTSVTVPHNK